MASVKNHIYRKNSGDPGTTSCDYRGKGELGAGENDQHRTFGEIDPAPPELIALVLAEGPAANRVSDALTAMQPDFFDKAASLLGLAGDGPIGSRIGVWDN